MICCEIIQAAVSDGLIVRRLLLRERVLLVAWTPIEYFMPR
jgi:hypothetical protein